MKRLLFAGLGLSLAMSLEVRAAAWPPEGLACPQRTVVIFGPGPSPERAKTLFPAHLAFVTAHLKAGDILTMGPFGPEGGLAVLPGKEWSAIDRLLEGEPFTRAGVFKIMRHEVWAACASAN